MAEFVDVQIDIKANQASDRKEEEWRNAKH